MRKLYVVVFLLNVCAAFGQVNLPTGNATFSIPMFDWKDDKSRLNFLTELNYNSGSGLKVNAVASNVGQGWELLCGGVITRMQVGEPDDQMARDGAVEDVTKYPPGYLYDPRDASSGCPNALTRYPIFGDQNHIYKQHNSVAADRELDHFAFQFNGRNGIFVLQKGTNTGIFLGDTKLKMWYVTKSMTSQGIRTTIDTFYIQDENGLIYKFAQHDLAKELKTKFCDVNQTAAKTQPNMKGGNVYYQSSFDDNNPSSPLTKPLVNPWVITGWHLSVILDPLTGRKVTFSYNPTPLSITNSAGAGFSYYSAKNYDIVTYTISKTQTPQLQSVAFPDGHQVALNYGGARVDLNGDYALASVDVLFQGRYLSEFQLTTSYFIQNRYGAPASDFENSCARLCLTAVRKLGVDRLDEEPPYKFDYYLGSSNAYDFVPPPFYYMKDIWGYYNGSNSVDAAGAAIAPTTPVSKLNARQVKGLCYMRDNDPNPHLNTAQAGYAKNGLLKQVIYPTGGMLVYEYDQNKMANGQLVGGVHVSKTKISDGGFSNSCGNPLTTNYYYTTDHAHTQSSLYVLEAPLNSMASFNNYSPESPYFYYRPLFHFGCDHHYKYPGILSIDQAISLTASQQFWMTFSKVMDVLGAIMDVLDIVNVCLDATPAALIALALDVVGVLVELVLSCTTNQDQHNTETVYYNSDVNAANPLPSSFKRLEVVEGGGDAGTTIYEYTNPQQDQNPEIFAVWLPSNPTFSMEQRFPYWAYGQPLKTTYLNSAGQKVKEIEYTYDPSKIQSRYGVIGGKIQGFVPIPQSCKCYVTGQNSERNDHWATASEYGDINSYVTSDISGLSPHLYGYYSGRLELSSTFERVYKPGDESQFQETQTYYYYNSTNYQVSSTKTHKSNGEIANKNYGYTVDFASTTGILAKMVQNNMVNDLVATYSSVDGISSPISFLDEKVTEFTTLSTGAIKPWRTLEQRFSIPQSSATFRNYKGPGDVNNPVYKQTALFVYNAAGNMVGVQDEGGRIVTNIYDYSDKYVVASVINADPILDQPAYTSFETDNLGGWIVDGSVSRVSGTAVTGNHFLTMSGATLTTHINHGKPYILSFWASVGSFGATGTRVKSSPTIGGFTYYEYAIPQGTSSVIINGAGNIDEVRLYPRTARMRTVSYDPLIGKTAECDENNRITYYEYDGLARLRTIRDENRNIVKMYEYNYAYSNQTSCVTTFYNYAISEQFVKQNCGAGKTGLPVTYTVPAGKYSSTVSQEIVDQQAQAELDNLGQKNADQQLIANACVAVFTNRPRAQTFVNQAPPSGYKGIPITYSVPAGRYTSLIDSADADRQAQEEIDANGQATANAMTDSVVVDTAANWIGSGTTACWTNQHMAMSFVDQNPNSQSYNQTRWIDTGYNASCPLHATVYAKIGHENVINHYGNVVVRFYSNASCTQPVAVSNLIVQSGWTTDCDNGGGNTQNTNNVMTANGTSLTISGGAHLDWSTTYRRVDGTTYTVTCTRGDFLIAGDYVIVN